MSAHGLRLSGAALGSGAHVRNPGCCSRSFLRTCVLALVFLGPPAATIAQDTWTPTSTVGAPTGRSLHTAVWTGSRMVVWGGANDNTGGVYDPATDSWTP